MTSSELPAVEDEAGTRTRPCEWCGAPVQQPATGRTRLHCKQSHRQRAYEARRLMELQAAAARGREAVETETETAITPVPTAVPRRAPVASPEPVPVIAAQERPAEPPRPKVQPRRQLSRKRALAVIDAAELVKADDWSESSRWLLRSGETVLGVLAPDYSGLKRNGWSGIVHETGVRSERRPTREAAAVPLADAWLRQVTAKPRTSLTG